ncbi:hypothetical protein J4476_04810 [Candidatus Woesearchaeota archaeon]|nr:MAG: hypothetical protein QT09_C0004G0026 [archaeon GW2011_AR18]MBS3161984.1 hypothetical protein [Candidatus Woesearchaeota archaeon]HIH25857.1 hypothetical protein [Nanoarchaeota archaeon]
MANEEKIGFHKGCLTTLSKEREELLKLVNITEQLMGMHLNALKELGIDIEKDTNKHPEVKK